MKNAQTLPSEYFENYGGTGIRYGLHHDEFECVHNYIKAWEVVLAKHGRHEKADYLIHTYLDVGAATGDLMRIYEKAYGFKATGVENSGWAKDNAIPEYRSKILWGDWFEIAPTIKSKSFDFATDWISQYMPPDRWDEHFSHLKRITKKGFMPITDYDYEVGDGSDKWRTIKKSKKWWIENLKPYCVFADVHDDLLVCCTRSSAEPYKG